MEKKLQNTRSSNGKSTMKEQIEFEWPEPAKDSGKELEKVMDSGQNKLRSFGTNLDTMKTKIIRFVSGGPPTA